MNAAWRRTATALVVALLIPGIFGRGVVSAAPDPPPPEASAIAIPPGRIDGALSALDAIVGGIMRRTGVPGIAVAVVHGDRVVYLKGFGVRRVGTNEKVDANTIFELASVSKPLGASVIAGAVGRGIVAWSDPVVKHLPGFTLADPYVTSHVTLADLYAHRSGLPAHAGDLLEDLGFDRASVLERLALVPLQPFRITYNYTNFGITAAAESVARAAGTSWEDLSHAMLYAPLGMTSTSSRYADYAKASDRAVLHVRIGNRWEARYERDADAQSPAGGASSSVRDMATWLRFELAYGRFGGKQIVDQAALLRTWMPAMATGPPATPISRSSFYGLGMNVGYDSAGRLRLGHSGGFASGGATVITMLPSEKLGIVVLTNGMPVGVPESISEAFFEQVEYGAVRRDWLAAFTPLFAAMYENPSALAGKTRPSDAAPAKDDAAYVGSYANAYYGAATVAVTAGGLVLTLGPQHKTFPLTHWSGDTFSYLPTGENAVGISAVTFTMGPDGRATACTVEYLDAGKLGTFTRS